MIIGILFVLEATVLIIVWLKYIIDYFRFEKKGIKLKQERLLRLGTTLATIGTVIGIVVPRLIGIRYDTSSKAQIVYLLITLLGVCLALLGFPPIRRKKKTRNGSNGCCICGFNISNEHRVPPPAAYKLSLQCLYPQASP